MKNLVKCIIALSVIAIFLVSNSAFAQGCPMCKEAMTDAGPRLSNGFYYSILSMFIIPVSMIGAGTVFVAKKSWKRNHPEAENLSTWQVMKEMLKERKSR